MSASAEVRYQRGLLMRCHCNVAANRGARSLFAADELYGREIRKTLNGHATRQTLSESRREKEIQSRDPVVVIKANVVIVIFAHDFQAV